MLPSRGLRPTQLAPLASRQSTLRCSNLNTARKFSALSRTAGLAHSPRTSLLAAQRRTVAGTNPHVALGASSVRYGSWYAPWSWGRGSTPGGPVETVPVAEFSNTPAPQPAPAPAPTPVEFAPEVTTATPEIAPAGIDKAAVTESTATPAGDASSTLDAQTLDALLGNTPVVKDVVEFDPSKLIDHPGNLAELGLDYGWGMTTVFEKLMETIYLQSGWGWAGTIVATTVVVRSGLFVFQALSSNKMAGMAALKPVTAPLQEKLDAAIKSGNSREADLLKMQQAAVLKPYMGGIFLTGGFTAVQAYVGFCAFRLLRAMGELPVPGMVNDGWLWFTDLSVRDPYFILPAATTGIMYMIFKNGGETGVADATSQAASRKKLMSYMAFFIGLITAFQASGLQLYFLVSGLIGGCTSYLLRQNGFRRLIRITPMPSPESHEVFSKVVRGELKLKDIKGPDGKIRYQPPTPPKSAFGSSRGNTTLAGGLNVKGDLPLHLRAAAPKIDKEYPDRDADFEVGPKGGLSEKMDYYRRNYKLSFVKRRMAESMRGMMQKAGYDVGNNLDREAEKKRRKAELYEVERRRRFENRG